MSGSLRGSAPIDYNSRMRRYRLILQRLQAGLLFVPFLLLLASPAEAARRKRHSKPQPVIEEPHSLAEALDQAARRSPAAGNGLSIEIASLETGAPVFERNPDSPETIASITKLFSTAAALHFLGPDYKFKTTFWRQGEIKDGVLEGSLLVVGGGDPNISGRFYNDDYNE